MHLSLADYRESLAALTELELWYARRHAVAESIDLPTAVNTWTDLYHFSVFYDQTVAARDNPKWNSFLRQQAGDGVVVFMRHFELRLATDLQKAQEAIRKSFAGFTHEFHYEYFQAPDTKDLLTLHFRNYFGISKK